MCSRYSTSILPMGCLHLLGKVSAVCALYSVQGWLTLHTSNFTVYTGPGHCLRVSQRLDHRPVTIETVAPAPALKLRRRRKTWVEERVRISCSRQAEAKLVRDYHHRLSDTYRAGKLGMIPCQYAILWTIVSLVIALCGPKPWPSRNQGEETNVEVVIKHFDSRKWVTVVVKTAYSLTTMESPHFFRRWRHLSWSFPPYFSLPP